MPAIEGVVTTLVDGDTDRVALGLEYYAGFEQIVPGIDGLKPVVVENVLPVQGGEVDEVFGKTSPHTFDQPDLFAKRDPATVRVTHLLGNVAHVEQLPTV